MKKGLLLFFAVLGLCVGKVDAQILTIDKDTSKGNTPNEFTTGVAAVTAKNDDIVIYPNPAQGELNVLFDANSGIKNIAVYNLIGKTVIVYKVSGNSAKLSLDSVPSGIYFIRLIDETGRVVAMRKFTHQ